MAKFQEACVVTFVLAMAVLMVLLPRQARADECAPREAVLTNLTNNHPAQVVVLDHNQSARVSAWWDASPPVSNDHFDLAIVLQDPARNVLLLLGRYDHICKVLVVPKQFVPQLLSIINGGPPA